MLVIFITLEIEDYSVEDFQLEIRKKEDVYTITMQRSATNNNFTTYKADCCIEWNLGQVLAFTPQVCTGDLKATIYIDGEDDEMNLSKEYGTTACLFVGGAPLSLRSARLTIYC